MKLSLVARPARADWAEGPCVDGPGTALAVRREATHRSPERKRVNLHGVTDGPFFLWRKGGKGHLRLSRHPRAASMLSGGFRDEPGSECAAEAMRRCFHSRA